MAIAGGEGCGPVPVRGGRRCRDPGQHGSIAPEAAPRRRPAESPVDPLLRGRAFARTITERYARMPPFRAEPNDRPRIIRSRPRPTSRPAPGTADRRLRRPTFDLPGDLTAHSPCFGRSTWRVESRGRPSLERGWNETPSRIPGSSRVAPARAANRVRAGSLRPVAQLLRRRHSTRRASTPRRPRRMRWNEIPCASSAATIATA